VKLIDSQGIIEKLQVAIEKLKENESKLAKD